MNKPVQYLTKEYLERCSKLTPDQIIEFLENYRTLMWQAKENTETVDLHVEPSLLRAFMQKARENGLDYREQIKELMKEWIDD